MSCKRGCIELFWSTIDATLQTKSKIIYANEIRREKRKIQANTKIYSAWIEKQYKVLWLRLKG